MNDNELNNEKAFSPDNMENALQDVLADAGSPEHGRKDWQHRVQVEDDKASDHDTGSSPTEEVPVDTDSVVGKDKPKVSFWKRFSAERLATKLKVDFRQPKYFFALLVLIPLLFLGYSLSNMFGSGKGRQATVGKDSFNATMPEAVNEEMSDKLTAMNQRFDDQGSLTAVGGIGGEVEQKDSVADAYQGSEADAVARHNAEVERQRKLMEQQQERMAAARRNASGYGSYGLHQEEMDSYTRDIEEIQRRSMERQRAIQRSLEISDERENDGESYSQSRSKAVVDAKSKPKPEPLVVTKVREENRERFHSIAQAKDDADATLIRAMIDQTTKAREGTRLRFKLLDDVMVKDVKLRKGTYLYGIVSGFGQQRVMANITSILVGGRFLMVNLSVYDNDGMEGFYVPESAFRDMMREAGAQSLQNNMSFSGGYGSELSGEAVALQALQNMYQSATNTLSAKMRQNKARIKYNTIVYLINKENRE
ncbi:conjugative transposon protein TraM [Bacteroides pyogenes]|uniref:conjugative transposon protein TraM n=1 Tax=Bacteroides pyogenes TaxID=310300 RepID=UPI0020113A32|nr:conjugative transposon protein TraM [Bacteroides pyogenes]MBR8810229.1 hypothetical protein [Bacteroides pyogenes]